MNFTREFASQRAERAQVIVRLIGALLAGEGGDVQGAALGELVAIYFAGHHASVREEMIETWLKMVRDLIPLEAR